MIRTRLERLKDKETRKLIVETVRVVSEKLGNTPAICRKCYIHPEVFAAFSDGTLTSMKGTAAPQLLRALL